MQIKVYKNLQPCNKKKYHYTQVMVKLFFVLAKEIHWWDYFLCHNIHKGKQIYGFVLILDKWKKIQYKMAQN